MSTQTPALFLAECRAARANAKAQLGFDQTVVDASDLFGDTLTRALYREDSYAVPADQRLTCPIHLDWRADCLHLHVKAA